MNKRSDGSIHVIFSVKRGSKYLSLVQSQVVVVVYSFHSILVCAFADSFHLIRNGIGAYEFNMYCGFIWFYSRYESEKSFSRSNVIFKHIYIQNMRIWLTAMLWLDALIHCSTRSISMIGRVCVLNSQRNSKMKKERERWNENRFCSLFTVKCSVLSVLVKCVWSLERTNSIRYQCAQFEFDNFIDLIFDAQFEVVKGVLHSSSLSSLF